MTNNDHYNNESYYTDKRGTDPLTAILDKRDQKHGGRIDFVLNKIYDKLSSGNERIEWFDIGCGTAPIARLINLKNLGSMIHTISLDFSPTGIMLAKELQGGANLDYSLAVAEKMPFSDSVADVVTLHDLIEHVTNPEEILLEGFRILKQNGLVHIVVPNPHLDENDSLSKIYLSDPTHIVPPIISVDYFREIMTRIGFSDVEVVTRGFKESEDYFKMNNEELFLPTGGTHIYITGYKT